MRATRSACKMFPLNTKHQVTTELGGKLIGQGGMEGFKDKSTGVSRGRASYFSWKHTHTHTHTLLFISQADYSSFSTDQEYINGTNGSYKTPLGPAETKAWNQNISEREFFLYIWMSDGLRLFWCLIHLCDVSAAISTQDSNYHL